MRAKTVRQGRRLVTARIPTGNRGQKTGAINPPHEWTPNINPNYGPKYATKVVPTAQKKLKKKKNNMLFACMDYNTASSLTITIFVCSSSTTKYINIIYIVTKKLTIYYYFDFGRGQMYGFIV